MCRVLWWCDSPPSTCCLLLFPLLFLSSPPPLVFPLLFLSPSPSSLSLSPSLLVGLNLFPCTFLHSQRCHLLDDRLSCVPWWIHLSQMEAALSRVRLLCVSSHKSQSYSPPAASTLKTEQNALLFSAKWEILCEVCCGLFEQRVCLFFLKDNYVE